MSHSTPDLSGVPLLTLVKNPTIWFLLTVAVLGTIFVLQHRSHGEQLKALKTTTNLLLRISIQNHGMPLEGPLSPAEAAALEAIGGGGD